MEELARKAVSLSGVPDAGIWEYRTEWKPQTFSSLMCWAAADRMARIADRQAPKDADEFRAAAGRIHAEVSEKSWNAQKNSFVGHYGGEDLDASLLQMVKLALSSRPAIRDWSAPWTRFTRTCRWADGCSGTA